MANPELGLKRVCVACSTKFYDLTKIPAICPKCGTEQPPDQPKLKRAAGNVVEEKRPKKPAAGEDSDVDTDAAEDDVDEDVLEDTSDLEDDDTTIGGDIEVETEGNEDER